MTRWNRLAIAINGESLFDMLRRAEHLLIGSRRGSDESGINTWLPADDLIIHSSSLYGEPLPYYVRESGRMRVLACGGCGAIECDAIEARIHARPDVATWEQFRQARRLKWRYADFDFRFDRGRNGAAMENVPRKFERRFDDDAR